VALLEDSRLFIGLSEAELERLRAVTIEEVYVQGQQVFQEGDPGNGIYVVKSGEVQISALINEDERKTLSLLGEGDFFGEMAVLDNEPRSATVTALKDSVLYFIPRDELVEMLETSPKMVITLMRLFSLRLRDFNKHYIQEVLQSERLTVVGKFARSIVHDLKNPLNVIGLAAELAGSKNATLETRTAAKTRIRKQVDRLSQMINELLEFTRGVKRAVILSEVDYGAFARDVVEDISPEIEHKLCKIEFESEPPRVRILADPTRLLHVYHNLINNAVDAMQPKGGVITIRFRNEGELIVTELEDSGPGIDPEIAERLFEAFATFGKSKGTGLGLSICKKIINDHKGDLIARSEPGRGAIFEFSLPLRIRSQKTVI
jgi:signal transduction histidine kinase